MAAYAALLSLSQTADIDRSHDNYLFPIGAKENIRYIHGLVAFMLSFLENFPEKAKRWEGRIRDVAHETQDFIEEFRWLRIQTLHTARGLSNLEEQLQNATERLCSIAEDMMDQRPSDLPAAGSSSSSRLVPTGNGAVIGLEDDIMAIKEQLCGQSSNLQVIPIVGMGGIGKTTLARTVYDDQLITESFDIRAWVVVSQDYSPHRFRKILFDSMKLLGEQMSGDEIDDSEIELKVFKNLKGWRYLVVIDDVWERNVWDDVRGMFPNDYNGSRIMLTTRQLDVAAYPNSARSLYEMRFMNDSQSWDLLKQKVFTNGNCPSDLEGVGKEIARRCAGLPLAVVLVAGILSPVNNKTRASWEEIAENMNGVVGREIEEILSLSYTYLPHHLRPCFLFMGGFPEDANIPSSRLIRLWVAEGFVKHENGSIKSSEEEAEEYLEDLVKRNLVIVTRRKSDGKIRCCSLHDMVRDLCMRKAQEEKFLRVMDGPDDLPQGLMNIERHISFSRSDVGILAGSTFRTILCFQTQEFPSWVVFLGSYKLLRVLDVLGVDLKEIPSQVFELYRLRYLALIGYSLSIPSAISNLVNLQTLIIHRVLGKVRGKYGYSEFPSLPLEIWRMPQLRHLFFHHPYMLPLPPEGLNLPLGNLQTLFQIEDLVWNEKILEMIPNVKRLGLAYRSKQEYHLHHLKYLHQLEKLQVIGCKGFSWSGQNPSFPHSLKKLTIAGAEFPWKHMSIVGSLPNLEVLKLLDNATGETWKTTDEDFPRLRFLLIERSSIRQWITESKPFPSLKRLKLHSCRFLTEIPEGIGEIPTLELIELHSCTKSLEESAMKIKEDQEDSGNDALQVRVGNEPVHYSVYCENSICGLPRY